MRSAKQYWTPVFPGNFLTLQLCALIFLILCNISSGIAQTIYAGLPIIENFKPSDYQGGIQNWMIAQDERGILYFANNHGLLEFDGANWQVYQVQNKTKVLSIHIDKGGRIQTGNQGDFGYFFPDSTHRLSYSSIGTQVPGVFTKIGETKAIHEIGDALFFSTPANLYIYQGGIFSIITFENTLEYSFLFNNKLYLQEYGKGLTVLNETRLEPVPRAAFFNTMKITAVIPLNDNNLILVTHQNGLYHYNRENFKKWPVNIKDPTLELSINCAIKLKDGRIAMGTQNHGVIILDAFGNFELDIDKKSGLLGNTVLSLFQDKHNNIWVGLNNGIALIEISSPFTLLNDNLGIEGTGYSVCPHGEHLYVGTNIGAYRSSLTKKNTFDLNLNFQSVTNSQGQVNHLLSFGNGILLSHENGLFVIKDLKANIITDIPDMYLTCCVSKDGTEYIAGNPEGLYSFTTEGNKTVLKSKIEGINHAAPIIVNDRKYNIWMTYGYGGVYKIRIGEDKKRIENISYYPSGTDFPSDRLINIFYIKNDLVFTAEDGIYRYDESCDCFKINEELTDLLGMNIGIREMEEDPYGNVYFIAKEKIGVLWFDNLGQANVTTDLFQKIEGMLNDDAYNITVTDMNNVFFSGKEGFIHYNPTRTYIAPQAFDILLRKVESISDNDSLLFGGSFLVNDQLLFNQPESAIVTFPNHINNLRFSYSAAYFDGFVGLKYRYILENFDKDWSTWTSKTYKEYTNLAEGKYIFKVQAKNIYGTDSSIYSYSFSIAKPWYKSPFAYLFFSICGLILFVLSIYVVDKKYRSDTQRLISSKNKQLSEKESELKLIEARKNAEITRLSHEKLEAEIHYKNKELASSTMTLITKNEVIAGIRQKLVAIIKREPDIETKRTLNKIIKDINSNISIDQDWKQFEFHFDQVHGDFSSRMKGSFPNLSPQEMKLCAYLRLNLSSKEIAQLLNISTRGVEIARYRLRKKINLERHANLSDFILNF